MNDLQKLLADVKKLIDSNMPGYVNANYAFMTDTNQMNMEALIIFELMKMYPEHQFNLSLEIYDNGEENFTLYISRA